VPVVSVMVSDAAGVLTPVSVPVPPVPPVPPPEQPAITHIAIAANVSAKRILYLLCYV
jgi:hypothetical protein